MEWLLWAAAGAYAGGAFLVWCCTYGEFRRHYSRRASWGLAALVAVVWLPWLVHLRRSTPPVRDWVDQLESELHALGR